MPNTYDKGDQVTLRALFTLAGIQADPTTSTVKTLAPDGTVVTKTNADPEVTSPATGDWVYDLTLDQEGVWTYRWEGVGAVVAAGENTLLVRQSAFP